MRTMLVAGSVIHFCHHWSQLQYTTEDIVLGEGEEEGEAGTDAERDIIKSAPVTVSCMYETLIWMWMKSTKVIVITYNYVCLHEGTALLGMTNTTPPSPEPCPPFPFSLTEAVGFNRRPGSLSAFTLTCGNNSAVLVQVHVLVSHCLVLNLLL